MPTSRFVERLVRRDEWIVGVCLALASASAWLWLAAGGGDAISGMDMAGMDMPGMDMTAPALASPAAGRTYFLGASVMWALMMTAMMLPSAAPMILLYARFSREAKARAQVLAPTAVFAATYLAVWGAVSVIAAALQAALVHAGLMSAARLAIGAPWLGGCILLVFGAYQLTPLKEACLSACRAPMPFLMRAWRPGIAGSLRAGIRHSLSCVGCCWAMMALLFVTGVMNLAWIGVISVAVLLEKVAPRGRLIGQVLGVAAAVFGLYEITWGR